VNRKPGYSLIESMPQFKQLQDLIWDKAGVECSIVVKPSVVSIRTKTYVDFVMAKAAIKGRVSQPIIHDVLGLKEASEHSNQHDRKH